MPLRSWQGGGAPNPGDWDQANNWVGGVVPIDGDTVDFLQANFVAACTAGPAAGVTLISITDDAGYSIAAGAGTDICFANITVTTVTVLSSSDIAGGTVATANLSGAIARITGGTIETATLTDGHTFGGTITTLTLGASGYADGAGTTATTVYANGSGGNCYINAGTYGTVYLDGDAVEFRANPTATTVYVNSLNADISATAINAGNITNGPYIMNRNAILYDYDTGLVMCDTNWVPRSHEGQW
jgi:hypothetical protein